MAWQSAEIRANQRLFYYQDESHLVWGDVCGYAWGLRGKRLRIPVVNERIRQTYFGVLDVVSGKAWIRRSKKANGITMVAFLRALLKRNKGKKITLCWDKVPYHRSRLVKTFIRKVNANLEQKEKRLILIELPANAPEENLMEEVWLYGKTAIRKAPKYLLTFEQIKLKLEKSIKTKKFDFKKLKRIQKVLQII